MNDLEKKILQTILLLVLDDPNILEDLKSVLHKEVTELDLKLLCIKLKESE